MKCGLPNFSTTFFDSSLSSFASSNSFSAIDASHSCITSTPNKTAPKKRQPQTKLKILNINCLSIVNKVKEFWALVETEKPDIIVGTESWLHRDISDSEVFPPGYTPFRADRSSTKRGGGVFVLVHEHFICTEQPEFHTDCELGMSTGVRTFGLRILYRSSDPNFSIRTFAEKSVCHIF